MSQENVEIVRRALGAAWDDLSSLLALVGDDLVVRRHAPLPDPGTWSGPEGLLNVATEWGEGFDEWTVKGEEFMTLEITLSSASFTKAGAPTAVLPLPASTGTPFACLTGRGSRLTYVPRVRWPSKPPGCRSREIPPAMSHDISLRFTDEEVEE